MSLLYKWKVALTIEKMQYSLLSTKIASIKRMANVDVYTCIQIHYLERNKSLFCKNRHSDSSSLKLTSSNFVVKIVLAERAP